ncbi:MAG: 30S ribosomal protein S20 [Parvularculaceae bacterium]|nr:30S ribosomal protein S20 [Parvularculaceae bacterium]
MPNTTSAKKMVRKIKRRTEVNKNRRSRVRTFVRQVEEALDAKDGKAAKAAFQAAQPELHRAVTKGVMKKETVARKLSRLSHRIKTLSAPAS